MVFSRKVTLLVVLHYGQQYSMYSNIGQHSAMRDSGVTQGSGLFVCGSQPLHLHAPLCL